MLSEVSLLVFIIILDRSDTFCLTVFAREMSQEKKELTHVEYISEQMTIMGVKHAVNTYHSVTGFAEVGNRFVWMLRAAHHMRQLLIQL